jgi:hypothetical protein
MQAFDVAVNGVCNLRTHPSGHGENAGAITARSRNDCLKVKAACFVQHVRYDMSYATISCREWHAFTGNEVQTNDLQQLA